jgi:hypothetical protein
MFDSPSPPSYTKLTGRVVSPHISTWGWETRAKAVAEYVLVLQPFTVTYTQLSRDEKTRPVKKRDTTELRYLAGHLLKRADDIESLLNKSAVYQDKEQDYLREAAILACKTLRKTTESRYLRNGIKLLARAQEQTDDFLAALRQLDGFLELDRKLFRECGAPDGQINQVIAIEF